MFLVVPTLEQLKLTIDFFTLALSTSYQRFHAWMIFIFSYSVIHQTTMRIIRHTKIVTNTESLHRLLEELLKVLHSCLSSEITLSLPTRVILFILVPLSDKKGFTVFETLLCLALSCNSISFFIIQLTKKIILFLV